MNPEDTSSQLDTSGAAHPVEKDLESILREIWSAVLRRPADQIGIDDNFFSIGGDSILVMELMDRVHTRCYTGRPADAPGIAQFFSHGTIRAQASLIAGLPAGTSRKPLSKPGPDAIAIIGMACRLPGASDPSAFWTNLCAGVEAIAHLSEEDLLRAGVPSSLLSRKDYVRVAATIKDARSFDASFFGMTPQECLLTSPEQRILIECSEEALQDAGYGGLQKRDVGVFVGTGVSSYLLDHAGGRNLESAEGISFVASNTAAAARISYVLDLKGPAITVDTACSSSLVAVHLARIAILSDECHVALAGGATVRRTSPTGYLAQEGGIFSSDGHCRPFSPLANGTVPASGGAVVVLKRLSAAIAEHDHVYAVIRGSAINNDGGEKAGFTAPSAAGQEDVIRRALKSASVHPDDVQFIEAHGTGTLLGDQIEAAALRSVFARKAPARGVRALGAVKANIGHLEAAAGIAGLMKVALAIHHGLIPPVIRPADGKVPAGLEDTAFEMNADPLPWQDGSRRCAGVSAFGIGGVNAHVILEGPASNPRLRSRDRHHLLVVSATTESALRESCRRLAAHLVSQEAVEIADVAFTLQVGRRAHRYRHAVVVSNCVQAAARLREFAESADAVEPAMGRANTAGPAGVACSPTARHIVAGLGEAPDPAGPRSELLQAVGAAWQAGLEVDWAAFNAGRRHYRISLPPTPFEKREYWLPPSSGTGTIGSKEDSAIDDQVERCLYIPVWRQHRQTVSVGREGQRRDRHGETCMLVNGPRALAQALQDKSSELGMRFKHVVSGDRNAFDAAPCSVDRRDAEAFAALLDRMEEDGHRVTVIVHFDAFAGARSAGGTLEIRRQEAVDAVLELSRAIALKCRLGISMTIVSEGAQAIGSAATTDAEGSMRAALAGVIEKEVPGLSCQCVDVSADYSRGDHPTETAALLEEVFSMSADSVVGLRGRSRWRRSFERLTEDPADVPASMLDVGGVYVITGGLGGVGWTLAGHLAGKYRARLALVGRREFPARECWPERLQNEPSAAPSLRIAEIQALEQRGAEIMIIQADVTNRLQMETAIAQVCDRFGRIDGVIHAAGNAGVGPIHQRQRESAREIMAPKVEGTMILFDAIRGAGARFFVCCSSMAALTSPAGLADYSAANAFQDAFCRQHNELTPIVCVSINWDAWRGVGFAMQDGGAGWASRSGASGIRDAVSPDDGVRVLDSIMRNPHPQYAVTYAGNPDKQVRAAGLRPTRDANTIAGLKHSSTDVPLDGPELLVAEVWRDVLGVEAQSADDDFFALGGDSISILEVRMCLEARSHCPISLNELMRVSTITGMAGLLSGRS